MEAKGFAFLTELVCNKGHGECYTNIQKTVEYCNENTMDENCIRYLSCDCLVDFLSVIETLSEDGKDDFLNVHTEIVDKMVVSGTKCR